MSRPIPLSTYLRYRKPMRLVLGAGIVGLLIAASWADWHGYFGIQPDRVGF